MQSKKTVIRKSVPTLLFLQETQQYAEAYTKKVRNNSRIHPFTHTKCLWYLFLAETNPRSKFFPSIKLTSTDSSGAICVYLNFLRIFWLVSQNWCKYLFIFLFWLAYKICCIKKVLISLKESYIVGWHRPNNVNITHSCFAIMLFFQLSTKASVSVLNMCSKCWFTKWVCFFLDWINQYGKASAMVVHQFSFYKWKLSAMKNRKSNAGHSDSKTSLV